jgi:hypothetical protein
MTDNIEQLDPGGVLVNTSAKTEFKQRIKLSRATGLLRGIKSGMECTDNFSKEGVIKVIDEVLGLLE